MSICAAAWPADDKDWVRKDLGGKNDLSKGPLGTKKSRAQREPGLRYWPREADTITFQEGLLNHRATGGGGHMRDATAQRLSTMILISAVRQPSEPHVSHAMSGAFIK